MKNTSYIYLNLAISAFIAFIAIPSLLLHNGILDIFNIFDGSLRFYEGIVLAGIIGFSLQFISLFLYKIKILGATLAVVGSIPLLPFGIFYTLSFFNKARCWKMRGYELATSSHTEQCDNYKAADATGSHVLIMLFAVVGLVMGLVPAGLFLFNGIVGLIRNQQQKKQCVIGINSDFFIVSLDPSLKNFLIPIEKVKQVKVEQDKFVLTVETQDGAEFSIKTLFSQVDDEQRNDLRAVLIEKEKLVDGYQAALT
ncbi:hypothetical protein MHO82_20415 [Vibrio sp. Of7-15]|uniref:hypothetical protein n=1 Tax=Vibrio sp. Of7-15 TaxID=2724879 RepID=UPI001EF31CB4|nr:hypothetical protein [Vibrio sp. Of7-15]MCG7499234.1 hypothetical protein [Vibrio sp. Of7-15]